MSYKKILFRRDTAANWTSENPVLSAGEIGLETDTNKIKLGNGSTTWSSLPYFYGSIEGASLDGLGDVTITNAQSGDVLRWNGTAWINDPINLSTDTVGDYVQSLVAGTGVTLTNNSGEATTPTVAIGQSVATNASVTFADVTTTGNVVVGGDLTVNGATVTLNTETLSVEDNIVVLNSNVSGAPVSNAGIEIERGSSSNVLLRWNEGSDKWEITEDGATYSNVAREGSIALGTHTTGNYMSDLTQGTGVTVTHTPGEGSNATIAIGQAVATSSSVTFAHVSAPVTGNVSGNLTGNVTGNVTGNADTATTLATSRTISLSGDVSGSVSFNGSSDASISATIQPNSVELGTDTTGNYVNDLTAGTGVTVTHTPGEGSSPTVAIGQAVGTSASVTFAHVTADVTGNVTGNVTGSSGSTTGNAATATTLATSRTISLSGDVSGSVSFNGSENADISAAIQPNSVALGTDTTGNYVADVTAGTGITVTHTPGEGSSATIAIPQSVATSASPTFAVLTLTGTPTETTHAVTKSYADSIAAGINWHGAVELATVTTLPNSPTYDNGASGVGATLTAGANARLSIDGVNATTGDRVLVKDQANAAHNGIYDVTEQGSVSVAYVLTRAADGDGNIDDEVIKGDAIYVANGAININQGFILTSDGTGANNKHIIGTDSLNWTQFTGTANINAGTGITKTGNTIAIGQDVATSASVTFAKVTAEITGNVTGNASTASSLQTSRTISLGGDVTGSVSFNGSTDATITATIAANSVALGTDTTGNYVADVTAGTGVTVTHTPGEGSSATIAIPQSVATSASPTFVMVTVTGTPSENTHVATKEYVDSGISSATINALDEIGDVTITTATSGQFLKWNSTAWVNDAIDLGTDTTGNYMSDVSAGTGISVTHTPAEGSTATVALNATLDDLSNVSASAPSDGQFLKYVTASSAWVPAAIPTINNLDDVGDVTITSAASGQFLKWNGTVWVNDAIDLGTDTTGNYMSDVSAGTGVTITHTPGEGSSASIAIGQSVATNANPSFAGATLDAVQIGITAAGEIDTASGNLTIDSAGGTVTVDDNLIVSGDLTINGTTTTINTATLNVSDNIVILNNDVTGSPTEDAGIEVERGTSANVLVRWNEVNDKWEITNDGTNYGNIVSTYDTGTVTSTMIADGTIADADINASAAIALSKLASGTSAQVVLANSGGVPTYTTISGDVTVSNTGVTAIGSGVIVNADVNASAAIDYSKLASLTSGNILVGNGSNVATSTAVTGDVTISNTGVTAIGSGVIVNADISSTAAIELGKLADVSTNAKTASYTLVLADKNKIVEMGVGSANNLTVPLNSSVAFPVGSQINILQTGAGQTTVVATGGVTINASPGLKLRTQWSYATLIKRAENTWVLVGDISA